MSLGPFCFGKWQAVPCILQKACLPGIANSYWMITIFQAVIEHFTCFILLLPFPRYSEVDTSIIIPFYNWENWGTERLHHISSVILSVLTIWPLCRHCLWHNPHFHLRFLKNSLNSLKRLYVSWWGLDGGENGTASGSPWALLCAYSHIYFVQEEGVNFLCLWSWVMLQTMRCDKFSQDRRNYFGFPLNTRVNCVDSWNRHKWFVPGLWFFLVMWL